MTPCSNWGGKKKRREKELRGPNRFGEYYQELATLRSDGFDVPSPEGPKCGPIL